MLDSAKKSRAFGSKVRKIFREAFGSNFPALLKNEAFLPSRLALTGRSRTCSRRRRTRRTSPRPAARRARPEERRRFQSLGLNAQIVCSVTSSQRGAIRKYYSSSDIHMFFNVQSTFDRVFQIVCSNRARRRSVHVGIGCKQRVRPYI